MSEPSALASSGVQGSWLRLAALMGWKPEMAVFRRFRKLNALRLLEMQSSIAEQQKDFEYICSLDAAEDCSITRSYQTDWSCLNESKGKGGSLQRDAWGKLRDKLDTYSEFGGIGQIQRSLLIVFYRFGFVAAGPNLQTGRTKRP